MPRVLRVAQLAQHSAVLVEELEMEVEHELMRKAAELEATHGKPAALRTYSALVKKAERLEERARKLQEDRAKFKDEARRALEALETTRKTSHASLKAEVADIFRAFEAEMEAINAKTIQKIKKTELNMAAFAQQVGTAKPLHADDDDE